MRPSCANRSHADAGRNRAVVCSKPPSGVGVGILTSGASSWPSVAPDNGVLDNVGKQYTYICVVKRLGTFVGVTQRVNGVKPSASRHQHLSSRSSISASPTYQCLLSHLHSPTTRQTSPCSRAPLYVPSPSPPHQVPTTSHPFPSPVGFHSPQTSPSRPPLCTPSRPHVSFHSPAEVYLARGIWTDCLPGKHAPMQTSWRLSRVGAGGHDFEAIEAILRKKARALRQVCSWTLRD